MRHKRAIAVLISSLALATLPAAPSFSQAEAPAFPGCAESPEHAGGDWRHYGGDLNNSRSQPAETKISAANASNLDVAWTWNATAEGLGGFYSTPVVYKGCIFLTTFDGYVVVRNADTGELVWRNQTALEGNHASLIGGVITGSPAVSDDLWIYVGVLRSNKPYTAAFKPTATGGWELAWTTIVDETPNSMIVTGPQLYTAPGATPEDPPRQLLFQGFMGAESTATPRGGYAILDATTGAIATKGYSIDDAAYAEGFRGASLWGTPAVDQETLTIYAPTGNPATKNREHKHANSILKIDGNPTSPSFGAITGHYKGNPDNYVEQVDVYNNPVCQQAGNIGAVWGQLCGQMDLDFGAAPNIMRNAAGETIVGALQKSGVYHAIDAATMTREWTAVVGGPGVPLNSASTAFDKDRIFVNAQPPGQLWGLNRAGGAPSWVQPMVDGVNYMPPSTANGLVYQLDIAGNLRITDAATGVPVTVKSMTQEFGQPIAAAGSSAGIAVARNTVYLAIPEAIVAYRLP